MTTGPVRPTSTSPSGAGRAMGDRPILVSIAPSNYVEKARWALQLAKVAFLEEPHVPIFHRFRTTPLGGTSVPVLYFPDSKTSLTDSADIVALCAKTVPDLYVNPQAKELELHYDKELGPHTRRIAYFFAFKDTALAKWLLAGSVSSRFERVVVALFFPFLKMFLFRFMKVNEEETRRSLQRVKEITTQVDQQLGDAEIGTRFLTGDTFTAADIAFCSHMSVILGPPEHILMRPLPALGDPALQAHMKQIQDSKAAQFVLWCYKNKRPPMA